MFNKGLILLLHVFLLVLFNSVWVMGASEGHVAVTFTGETLRDSPSQTVGFQACQGILEATGIGILPGGRSMAQARLLAERSAKIRAYRNLIRAVDRLSPLLVNGTGTVSRTGFIRGARVIERRYLSNGQVEVKIALDVHFSNPQNACEEWITHRVKAFGLPIHHVDHEARELFEEDWVQLNK